LKKAIVGPWHMLYMPVSEGPSKKQNSYAGSLHINAKISTRSWFASN